MTLKTIMSRSPTNVLAGIALIMALLTATAAVWAPAQMPSQGVPVANRQLVFYRRGLSARCALVGSPPALFVLSGKESPSIVRSEAAQVQAANSAWGGANYWLQLPTSSFSLWWLFGLSLGLTEVAWFKPSHSLPPKALTA
jgi:hypothetical protein